VSGFLNGILKIMRKLNFVLTLVALFTGYISYAQTAEPTPPPAQPKPDIEELKLKLNEDGSHYVKFTFSNQTWLRFNQSNPGTTVLGDKAPRTFDIGLRRTRLQLYGQVSDHAFFYMQFGQNNFNFLAQNAGNRKVQAFFHDALGEYKVWKNSDKLKFGGGLTIANGLSRFSQPSVSTIMTMDVPVFAQATVDQTDQFSRKLSVYARGQLGKFDYRIVLSDPFPVTTNGTTTIVTAPTSTSATFAQQGHHKQYQGFFIYNFLDKEAHTTPYMTGTYLGKKKIFNIEAGFITQKNAMWRSPDAGVTTKYQNMNLWSVALYYDAPVNTATGTALSAYTGYFNLDYGTNYLRYNGIMNPANGIALAPGGYLGTQGNAFPMFGTGQVIYAQLGYLMKKDLLGEGIGTLMPYASIMHGNYDRLSDSMDVIDAGINWLIKGHNSKLTLDYQVRPAYEAEGTDLVKKSNKSQVVLQYQVFF
jgi:hypothetical protein